MTRSDELSISPLGILQDQFFHCVRVLDSTAQYGVDTPPPLSSTTAALDWDLIEYNSWQFTPSDSEDDNINLNHYLTKTPAYGFAYLCFPIDVHHALMKFGRDKGIAQWRTLKTRLLTGPMPNDWVGWPCTDDHQLYVARDSSHVLYIPLPSENAPHN